MIRVGFCWLVIFFFGATILSAQQVTIQPGPTQIAINQAFTITLTVQNQTLKSYSQFPEIPGFVKRGTSSSSSTNFTNGRRSSSQSIIQNYVASAQGEFKLTSFAMQVNGKKYNVRGQTIKVGPPLQRRSRQRDPFQDFFGNQQNVPKEFVNIEADAFFALTTDKSSVYVGEGFTLTLAFYVAEENRAEMRFFELSKQIPEIIKNIKPENSWEENFNIENIDRVSVEINGKKYAQYKIFQAAYYSLNDEPVHFPKVGLKLVKFKEAKNPTFFGRNKQEEIVTFYSKPKTVTIKQLPPHPLKEQVAVGRYRLRERLLSDHLKTGESLNYNFDITGEGNISAITEPFILEDDNFDIYAPNVRQDINRANGKVRGTKSFSYYGIPNEPGEYDLGDYIQFIYFNVKKEQYDTLRSDLKITIEGESKKNEHILSNDMGSFYDLLDLQDNQLIALDRRDMMRTIANVIIFVLMGIVILLLFKKQKK